MKTVFMIMPFEDEFFQVFKGLNDEFVGQYIFSNASDEGNPQNILHDIVNPIYSADFIIADLTGINSNVMYELGVAHSFGKRTIMITQDELRNLPFDIKQYRVYKYGTHFSEYKKLIEHIRTILEGAETGLINFSNPVSDFLFSNGISINVANNGFTDEVSDEETTEKGLLDFAADIETNIQDLFREIKTNSDSISKMGLGIKDLTFEIDEINASSDYGKANRLKQLAKKLAGILLTFGNELREHILLVNKDWKPIEEGFLGLINNKHTSSEDNKKVLASIPQILNPMKDTLSLNIEGANTFLKVMGKIEDINGNLNNASRKLRNDIASYQKCYDDIIHSIEGIIRKSEGKLEELYT